MNQPGPSIHSTTNMKPHPLHLAAAAAVTVLALVGTARLAGWMPAPTTPEPAGVSTTAADLRTASPVVASPAAPLKAQTSSSVTTHRHSSNSRNSAPRSAQSPEIAVSPAPTPGIVAAEPYRRIAQTAPSICSECGVVQSINEVVLEPKASGGGAIAGGIVGGIIGNQIGKGATRDLATILGAAGGAYAGNHIEKSAKESKRYEVVVRFEDGSTRSFSGETRPVWLPGDRVRIQNGVLTSAGGSSSADRGTI